MTRVTYVEFFWSFVRQNIIRAAYKRRHYDCNPSLSEVESINSIKPSSSHRNITTQKSRTLTTSVRRRSRQGINRHYSWVITTREEHYRCRRRAGSKKMRHRRPRCWRPGIIAWITLEPSSILTANVTTENYLFRTNKSAKKVKAHKYTSRRFFAHPNVFYKFFCIREHSNIVAKRFCIISYPNSVVKLFANVFLTLNLTISLTPR